MIILSHRRLALGLAACTTALGLGAWLMYLRADLVLSHYDAKAHLVVARRIVDNITPGWQQIGAVWLPLPHLINLLPTQVDFFYRTGAFASLVSIASFAVTAWAAARLVLAITASPEGAIAAAALLALNPNLLYLQSTPMTEPLLGAVTFVAALWTYEWVRDDVDRVPTALGCVWFAAAWSRYEAWLVLAAMTVAVIYAMARRGLDATAIATRTIRLALWPAAAVAIFLIDSRITIGTWFVSGGFYEIDPTYDGLTTKSLTAVWWGTHRLSGYVVEIVALATAAILAARALGRRTDAALLIPITPFASAALPFYAFFEGHPFRIRYMVPLVGACALCGGLAVGLTKRATTTALSVALAAALVASQLVESPPWSDRAPLIEEAQWDRPASRERRAVTACLHDAYGGEKIVASMASLAHYMQELSREGFAIADFVHEGTGTIWELVMETHPARQAGWMLVEEQSEGGDVLARRIARDPHFTNGMIRVCEGGGVALYRRN